MLVGSLSLRNTPMGPRVQRAPGLPCALRFRGQGAPSKLRADDAARTISAVIARLDWATQYEIPQRCAPFAILDDTMPPISTHLRPTQASPRGARQGRQRLLLRCARGEEAHAARACTGSADPQLTRASHRHARDWRRAGSKHTSPTWREHRHAAGGVHISSGGFTHETHF